MENKDRWKLEAEFKATITNLKDFTEHSRKLEAEIVEHKEKSSMAYEPIRKFEAEVEPTMEEAKRAAEEEVEATNIKLKKLEFCLEETEVKCLGIQTQLEMVEILKSGVDVELKATNAKKYGL
ncbi:hypothetical protein FXO38_31262 [Capsicum annuum]|uniref:Uncharacterized protein n=1 Tax=Capsicum annuum TaxID=4072 RepID=A0A2G2ZNX4_CAPAN|nr:hypothetical protein FXO38_31262 [Capsicum annuum]KAF3659720.1 hypothetical protein FXO37_13846 [Capsicum annuum]PHT83634.1 hypothetical protein T459_12077 [Capsicum annuum]